MIDETTTLPRTPSPGAGNHERRPHARASPRRRLTTPALADIRLGPLLGLYAWRLRHHALQELLAGGGIAIGVALVFGVLTASQSITGSAKSILTAISGKATLEVSARSPQGFSETLVDRIGELPGIRVVSPVLRADAVLVGPSGRRSIQLVGATVSLLDLEGSAARFLGTAERHIYNSLALTSSLAAEVGANVNGQVVLLTRGRSQSLPVHSVWGTQQIGPVAAGDIAASGLATVQRVLALPRHVTQVWIEPKAGMQRQVYAGLVRLAAGRVDVHSVNHELRVLDATSKPNTESSRLFAATGAIVGFLFVLNAMLLTIPERRRWLAEARTQGYSAGQVVAILGFQALVLGLVATVVGISIGYLLTQTLFGSLPALLRLYFPIGSRPIITAPTVALASVAGIVATLLASAGPLLDLSPRRPIDAALHGPGKVGHSVGPRTVVISAMASLGSIVAAVLLAGFAPGLSIAAVVLLTLGALAAVPALLLVLGAMLMPAAERTRRSMLPIALAEVQGTATRSLALAGVAALAAYGSVAVLGARDDLLRGLDSATTQFFDTADLWVTPAGNNPLLTDSFDSSRTERMLLETPGVAAVRTFQASLVDIGSRRLWIRARPVADPQLLQGSQLLRGNLRPATALIRRGGWAAVSSGFAAEHHLGLGSTFTLPTPTGPAPLRVAAITTNSGWPPGAITLSQTDYSHLWQTNDASALEVDLRPGLSTAVARRRLTSVLANPALNVQTVSAREQQNNRDASQGVQALSEISRLVLIAAALAIMFALGAAIAARRLDLASRKAEGYSSAQLWRVLLLDGALVIGAGTIDGAGFGLGAHAIASRWLRLSQGFPAPFSPDLSQVLVTLAIIALVTLAVVVVAGSLVIRVPPRLSQQE